MGADAVTAARYLLLILLAGSLVLWRGSVGGVDTPWQFTVLSAATTVFIVLPLYAYQLGIGRTTPLTAQVIRALGPVFVFALEQFDAACTICCRHWPASWVTPPPSSSVISRTAGAMNHRAARSCRRR